MMDVGGRSESNTDIPILDFGVGVVVGTYIPTMYVGTQFVLRDIYKAVVGVQLRS